MKNIIFVALLSLAVGGMCKPVMNDNEIKTKDALEVKLEEQLKRTSVGRYLRLSLSVLLANKKCNK